MWICPKCKITFKNTNQWHSCAISTIEDHLFDKPPWILAAFEIIKNELNNLNEFKIAPKKTSILYKTGATFLAVYLRKNNIKLEFQTKELKDGSIFKLSKRVSKNRVFNIVFVKKVEDLTPDLFDMIVESYNLIKGD